MDEHDSKPTEAELREAAALARALDEGEVALTTARELETVALLHFAEKGPLDAVRLQRAQNRAWDEAQKRKRFVRWAMPAFAFAAAAAVLIMVVGPKRHPDITPLPVPDTALLRAQAAAMRGESSALDAAMLRYRERMYETIRRDYGGQR
ncbi:MAG: hypothetical protein IPK60_21865 [Sandaracinaceae bacterium]|nr:hypothetical protein [Sandaracinaceae bacterium]